MQHHTSISVSELNRLARSALEKALPLFWVNGEVSNFSRASSGHWYFTLKDRLASVRCVMFRNRNQFVDWQPKDGEHVEVRAQATLYEGRGDFQLTAEAMRHAGQGAQFESFLRLKAKLEAQGIFDASRKRALPSLPRTIGIITSPQAAGLHDVLVTLNQRWPTATVILYPCNVQGDQASSQILAALQIAGQRKECDVLLMVRGGGNLDDMKSFNDEALALGMVTSPIPIVTGIGHETDFTIADFVADQRAPTPTGAAQLATPDRSELQHRQQQVTTRLMKQWQRILESMAQRLAHKTMGLRHPAMSLQIAQGAVEQLRLQMRGASGSILIQQRERIRELVLALSVERSRRAVTLRNVFLVHDRLSTALHVQVERQRRHADRASNHLALLNPNAVLQRGFAIVRTDHGNSIVRSPVDLQHDQHIDIELAAGRIRAKAIMH